MFRAVDTPQQPEQHVEDDDGTRVADMGKIVHRRSADVCPHVLRIERREILFRARERVVETESHRILYCLLFELPLRGGRNRVSDFG